MDEETVFSAYFKRDLAHCFNKRLRLNIAYSTSDFGDNHIGTRFLTYTVDKFLDFIGDVWNDLHGGAEIFTATFFIQYIPVNLTGSEIRVFVEILVNKTLIMAKIKIGLCTVFRYIYLTMLIRAHSTRVNIDIRIQLLSGNLKTACF